jgi:hypothetical protein
MEARFIDKEILYDGTQLRSHWAYDELGVLGDSIVAFIGGADVKTDQLVDLIDRRENDYIVSERMLHFIVEHFDTDLFRGVLLQRLLVAESCELLNSLRRENHGSVERKGDDLYVSGKKLSVSIATVSPVSTLIHLGINIDPGETPVETIGLTELGIEPRALASELLDIFVGELKSAGLARKKVRWVK